MGDSQSKKFGDKFLGKLSTELDKPAPVFNKSLFSGAGQGTQNAWNTGSQFSNQMVADGGLNTPMRDAIGSFNDIGASYWWAGDKSRQQLGDVDAGYNAMRANGGLSGAQSGAMNGLGGLVGQAGQLGGLNGTQQGAMGGLGNLLGRYSGISNGTGLNERQEGAQIGTQSLGDDYAWLSDAYNQDAPGYQRMRQQLLDDAVKNVGAGFTSSGRFGGGSYINDATEASLNAIAPLDYQNYQNDVNNRYRSLDSQRAVNQDVFGMGQTGMGNRLSAMGAEAGLGSTLFGMGQQSKANDAQALAAQQGLYNDIFGQGQTGIGNQFAALAGQGSTANSNFANNAAAASGRLGAASSLFGAGQQAIGNQQSAIDALGAIGAAQDANAQGALMGEADLFDRTQNADLNRLTKLGAAFGDPTAAANQPNWWQSGLGALLGFGGSAISGGLFG